MITPVLWPGCSQDRALVRANLHALKPQETASHGGDSALCRDTSFEGTRVTLYLIEISKLARKQKKNMSSQLHWCPSYVDEEKRAKLSFERAFLYYVPRNKQIGYKG